MNEELPLHMKNFDLEEGESNHWILINSKVAKFTKLLSELGLEYKTVFMEGESGGMIITIDECDIIFHLAGAIQFKQKVEDEE